MLTQKVSAHQNRHCAALLHLRSMSISVRCIHRAYHGENLEGLHSMLEKELWHRIPSSPAGDTSRIYWSTLQSLIIQKAFIEGSLVTGMQRAISIINEHLKCVCACFVPDRRPGMHAVVHNVVAESIIFFLTSMAHTRKSVCNVQMERRPKKTAWSAQCAISTGAVSCGHAQQVALEVLIF